MNDPLKKDFGVYYLLSSYGSLPKRIVAASIDLVFLILIAFFISWLWALYSTEPNIDIAAEYGWLALAFFSPSYFWTCVFISFIYLAIIKPSFLRTIGYKIAGLKIVNMKGNRPSFFQMTWRFLLLIFGPINLIIDIFWLGGDDDRQALRDKMAGIYVVGKNALPAGSGPFKYSNYHFLGLSFVFKEVKRPEVS
jgi:uncharacterized RDD family membrane protein YckC